MTQKEFETRVGIGVSADEFDAINVVYMNSDLYKDAFCELWVKMNKNRIAEKKAEQREMENKQQIILDLFDIVSRIRHCAEEPWKTIAMDFLTGKECKVLERAGFDLDILDECVWKVEGHILIYLEKEKVLC